MSYSDVFVALGTFCSALIPVGILEYSDLLQEGDFTYRFLWGASFLLNCIWVNIPGRFDSFEKDKDGKKRVNFPWKTVFFPSGWYSL